MVPNYTADLAWRLLPSFHLPLNTHYMYYHWLQSSQSWQVAQSDWCYDHGLSLTTCCRLFVSELNIAKKASVALAATRLTINADMHRWCAHSGRKMIWVGILQDGDLTDFQLTDIADYSSPIMYLARLSWLYGYKFVWTEENRKEWPLAFCAMGFARCTAGSGKTSLCLVLYADRQSTYGQKSLLPSVIEIWM